MRGELSEGQHAQVVCRADGRGSSGGRMSVDVLSGALSVATGLVGVVLAIATAALFVKRREVLSGILVAGMLLWCSGQALSTLLLSVGITTYPGVGGLLTLAAAPLFTAGFFAVRGHIDDRAWVIRCLLDTLMLAVAWLAVVWQFLLVDPVSGIARPGVSVAGMAVVLMGLMVTSTLFVVMTWRLVDALRGAMASLSFTGVGVVAMAQAGSPEFQVTLQQAMTLSGWAAAISTAVIAIRIPRRRAAPQHESGPTGVIIAGVGTPLLLLLLDAVWHPPHAVLLGILGGLGLLMVVRELRQAHQKRSLVSALTDLALADPLTGLQNRRALTDAVRQAAHHDATGWLITFDVDKFKAVNTERGHTGGDAVLVAVAGALTATCQEFPGSSAYRLGGDEFVVLHHGSHDTAAEVARRARELGAAAAQEAAGMSNVGLTLSAGVAALQRVGSPDPLVSLDESAQALRWAKEDRDVVRTYSQDLQARASHDSLMERRLREAISSEALEIHFQPIMHLQSNRVASFEALARWTDEQLGSVPPDVFVPLAEKLGLIHQLGTIALTRALALVQTCAGIGQTIKVSVNVSGLQLQRECFADEVMELLAEHDVSPTSLVLEITENISLDPMTHALPTLSRLSDAGVIIAIDDFGIGYSALGSMTRIPASVVKIDRSLITSLHEPRHQILVQSLIAMTRGIGLDVVVEGIEHAGLAELVDDAGAGYGQGWMWAPAVPASEVPQLLTRHGSHHTTTSLPS